MIIKNKKELATSKLRKQALEIIEAGIESVCPKVLLESTVKYNKKTRVLKIQGKTNKIKGRIFVIGGGKASGPMAEKIEKIIGMKNIQDGVVNCKNNKYKTTPRLRSGQEKIKIIKASHPLPNESGIRGIEKMLELKQKYDINENDMVLCLVSGGGSALMPSPVDSVGLEKKQLITQLLLESGASINEINTIRKHLSKIKGGRLAEYFFPAKVVSLIISDVVGDKLDIIASGPTTPDPSTFKDAKKILSKYDLVDRAPREVIEYIEDGIKGEASETPKRLKNAHNYIIGCNKGALEAMREKAESMKLKPFIVSPEVVGDPEIEAKKIVEKIIKGKYSKYNTLILGGETTPKLPKKYGQGGRNQHFVAATLLALRKYSNKWVMSSVGTDGCDYLPSVAGAVIDSESFKLAKKNKIKIDQYIKSFDTNTMFKKLGNSLVKTGSTGTNVGDIMIYIYHK